LRTASSLSCITNTPIRVSNIRAKRKSAGLKSQHLYTLKALADLFRAKTAGLELQSREITFEPSDKFIREKIFQIDLKTSGAIGLCLQTLVLVAAFRGKGITFHIKGGTCGLGAVPVDYYKYVIFPLLSRFGLSANIEIGRRGYYPKGGGEVKVEINPIEEPKNILLTQPGKILRIEGMSIASSLLEQRRVAQRQAESAERILKNKFSAPVKIDTEYAQTFSPGTELNLIAHTERGCILWSDARGERGKLAEKVGEEAAQKLIKEIDSGAACDFHLADNFIPWLCFLGGSIRTSTVSMHVQTNIWVCELFFGKIFEVLGTTISCQPAKI